MIINSKVKFIKKIASEVRVSRNKTEKTLTRKSKCSEDKEKLQLKSI